MYGLAVSADTLLHRPNSVTVSGNLCPAVIDVRLAFYYYVISLNKNGLRAGCTRQTRSLSPMRRCCPDELVILTLAFVVTFSFAVCLM